MHRLNATMPKAAEAHLHGDTLTAEVDNDVPAGFAPVRYRVGGFNAAYNNLNRGNGGHPMVQTELDIVFASGNHRGSTPDGVTPQALLTVVEDHLKHMQQTPNAAVAYSRATGLIREAIRELVDHEHELLGD